MPNTRADLERLKHHWQDVCRNSWGPEHVDEMIALCERLLRERDHAQGEIEERYITDQRSLPEGVMLEHARLDGMWQKLVRERDDARLRVLYLHAELIERCETMERMASDTPVWLIVFLDGPGRGPEVAQAIHFSADETVIYGTGHKLRAISQHASKEG